MADASLPLVLCYLQVGQKVRAGFILERASTLASPKNKLTLRYSLIGSILMHYVAVSRDAPGLSAPSGCLNNARYVVCIVV